MHPQCISNDNPIARPKTIISITNMWQNPHKGKLSCLIIEQFEKTRHQSNQWRLLRIFWEFLVINNHKNSWSKGTHFWYLQQIYLEHGLLNEVFSYRRGLFPLSLDSLVNNSILKPRVFVMKMTISSFVIDAEFWWKLWIFNWGFCSGFGSLNEKI